MTPSAYRSGKTILSTPTCSCGATAVAAKEARTSAATSDVHVMICGMSSSTQPSERQQEADQGSLFVPGQLAKCLRRGRSFPLMSQYGFRDAGGASVMQEPVAHAETPQWGGAPVLAGCFTLHDAVVHGWPQIVQEQVRIERHVDAVGGQRRRVARRAPNFREQDLAGAVLGPDPRRR